MYKQILKELEEHIPFTAFGAITGIILIIFFQKLPSEFSYNIFYTLHPLLFNDRSPTCRCISFNAFFIILK